MSMVTPTRVIRRSALALLLAVWLLWAPLTSAAGASPRSGRCLLGAPSDCGDGLALARAADSEEEGERGESEAESEEAEEEAASAEAEAEEAEAASSAPGSPGHHRGSHSSHKSHHNAAVISRLALTAKATAALKQSKPPASAVGFAFTLSSPAKVQVTLVMQTSSRGHKRWTTLPDSLTTTAGKGYGSRNLTGHNRLAPGRYRLTVKPVNGRSRSIYLSTSH